MSNTQNEAFVRLRTATQTLEALRDELSAALVSGRASGASTPSEQARLADLHRRVSVALAALCGEVRDH